MQRITQRLGKLRYPILILLLGIILLLIPGHGGSELESDPVPLQTEKPQKGQLSVEEVRLSELLSQVEGAGKVEVMLSLSSGGETHYQTDIRSEASAGEQGQSLREESTLLYDVDSNTQAPLIRQETAPVYQGALILCQGADDPTVRLALTQAVSSLTGLGADRIAVIKMN